MSANITADTKIKKWYVETYPTDELGVEINEDITFYDLFVALDMHKDVYEELGVDDSIVRERAFDKLAKIMNVDYDYIYEQWLYGGQQMERKNNMSKNGKIEIIKSAVEDALAKYDTENVDIVQNEDGFIDIIYHSRHNSFCIEGNVCTVDGLSEADIDNIAEWYDIGYCW